MNQTDFSFLSNLLKEQSGIVLTADKFYMLESRLMPVAREFNMSGLDDLTLALRQRDSALTAAFTEAMTTNETLFFRDIKPFAQFKDMVLPYLFKARANTKTIRILSAGASSGQEAYSIAMIVKDALEKNPDWNIEIVGIDISSTMINKAREGMYSQFEVQRGLPIRQLLRHFSKQDDQWQIDHSLRAMVQFKRWNLLDDIAPLGKFDVIFCRYVIRSFDSPLKTRILSKFANEMPADGCLFLGLNETVLGFSSRFKLIKDVKGLYAKSPDSSASAS
ncbi:MAG: protein-glutamate O-methyltransferase CheR [Alphaproteobacteria bacterium]|nr:protein-glutamate O-methyltransferase CheR [Elusimicrobiaceae bacterium]MBR7159140.1 protein-glutamate O-methyltransferase CheR [Alphaproteobacteria bacterium]